ncbi:hypothetical protein ZIOFF_024678 [Zingiber officinale]|uniref:Pre-mRNA-processing factor 19 n=1 Tax=Zingiber officinale TaxID=94328 RepID=A0A8J5HCX2_ZINOF|nr:hypothetical protein ZIOFF_024678 [Zingiber officinale]
MICTISGEVPEEPVVSKRSGLLFERRLIEHHIANHGKCPVTNEELSMDDLVAVKTDKVAKPRPLQAASIPGLLGMFQNEWDALMLSNFALENQLHTARQELSHALYQNGTALANNRQSLSCCDRQWFSQASQLAAFHGRDRLGNILRRSNIKGYCCHALSRGERCDCVVTGVLVLPQEDSGLRQWLMELPTIEEIVHCMWKGSQQWRSLSGFVANRVAVKRYCNCMQPVEQEFLLLKMSEELAYQTRNEEIERRREDQEGEVVSLPLKGIALRKLYGLSRADNLFYTNCIMLQHDAACRVIARLKKERDDARVLLSLSERQIRAESADAAVVSNGKRAIESEFGPVAKKVRPGINPSIIAELTECNALLSGQRKKRQIPATLAPVDALDGYTQVASHPLHKSNKPGILCIDIDASKDIIATGGVDSTGVLFNRTSGQILSTLTGHSKKVTSVKFVPGEELVITGSGDKTVRIWQVTDDENYDCRHVLRDHTAEVQAVTLHATNKYFVTASMDNTWCFYDLSTGSCLTQITENIHMQVGEASSEEGYTSASFHPDGLILGTGTTGALVNIWDIKSQSNVAKFDGHVGSVTAMSFSENGYFLATAAMDGVKLWDLRKLKNFRSFAPYDANTPTNSVEFDFSGSYLAIAGSDTRVYQVANVKQEWNLIKTFPDLSGAGKITSVKFGADARYMAVGSMDRNLRIFGIPGNEREDPKSPAH